MTLEEIIALEKQTEGIRDTMRARLLILNRHLNRLKRRRHNLMKHPNWQTVSEKSAWKKP